MAVALARPFLLSSSSSSSSFSSITRWSANLPFRTHLQSVVSAAAASQHTLATTSDFTWNDVVTISPTQLHHDSSALQGFFHKVDLCNRNSEQRSEFMPFVIEDQVLGYVHHGFANHLRSFKDVFIFPKDSSYGCHLALHQMLSTPEDRTEAVAHVIKCLAEEFIPGIRNELYPVTSSFGTPEFFSLERAAAPFFGIKGYGVHLNGYVEKENGEYLWVGKRSKTKSKYPGKLDHLVAGGLPLGIPCGENVVKECKEEAGIPSSISSKAKAVGAVAYSDIDGYKFNRDVLFCYDLKLPEDFLPINEDGEVESFRLLSVEHVANIIRSTEYYKENCNLVIIDFLFRRGYIKPEAPGYLKLLQSLRSGECT